MILRADPDRDSLRAVVRDFLGRSTVTAPGEGHHRWDPATWRRACSELGLAGVAEPDELGGAGFGAAGLAIVVQEAGRVVSPLPILGSVVLGQGLLERSGDDAARADMLPPLLDGSRTATVALANLRTDGSVPQTLEATRNAAQEWMISGFTSFVLDGDTASWVFVRAETADGPRLFAVEADDPRVHTDIQMSMDLTRTFARLEFADVPARPIGRPGAADAILADLRHLLDVAIACEHLGSAEETLRMAVEHVKVRVQFGRTIGSFQAIKHRCADLAILVDDARSALDHAVWALHTQSAGLAAAASTAAVVCERASRDCARENIHLHGGMGFTWEHPAHLYFRRATSNAALFLESGRHHDEVLAGSGVR